MSQAIATASACHGWFCQPAHRNRPPVPRKRRRRHPPPARFPDLLSPARLRRIGRERGLTLRQRQILRWLCRGLSNGEIAARLAISVETVRKHTKVIYQRFDVTDRIELLLHLVHSEIVNHTIRGT